MSPKQKRLRELTERKSKERARLAELGVVEIRTEEQNAEMDRLELGIPDLERDVRQAQREVDEEESEQRAAGAAARQPEGDAEDRERAELRSKIGLARFLGAALETRSADGAEAEYMAAAGMPLIGRNGGTAFPLELLAPAEERATTDVDVQTMPRRWLDRLFAETAALRLGITMESVPTGSASFPVTTAGASAAQRQRSTDSAADAAWTIGVAELKPKRNAVRNVFSIEDAARIPDLESALTRDLRMALTEGIDRAIFIGDAGATGSDADITGLSSATGVTEATLAQAAKVKGPETLTAFSGLVDGIHAVDFGDLNVVTTTGAWRLWQTTIFNSAADSMTLAQFLKTAGLMFTHRGEIEDNTADDDIGAFVGRKRGIDGAGVAAVWESGELIRDPYSAAAKGEIALTLCYLWDFGLPRPSNFARVVFDA